jgi:hypothetical protein
LVQNAINDLLRVGQHCVSPPQTPSSKIQMLDYWFRLPFFGEKRIQAVNWQQLAIYDLPAKNG